MTTILAIDGHDGAGKTTLARRLAEALGAAYLRPFAGPQGPELLAAHARGDLAAVDSIGRGLIEQALAPYAGQTIVCDRHWMTVCSLLPEPRWAAWRPHPATLLCWADLATTLARLGQRDEPAQPAGYHERYLAIYRALAEWSGCAIVRSDRLDEAACLELALSWARQAIGD
jgi:hypothetical protein